MFLKGDKRSGLLEGEIMEYANIDIQWIRGKKAILTIMDDDGKKLEEIKLFTMKTREEMHKLMEDKGFAKKTKQEKLIEIRNEAVDKEIASNEFAYNSMTSMYFWFFFVMIACGIFLGNGKKRNRKTTRTVNSSNISRV